MKEEDIWISSIIALAFGSLIRLFMKKEASLLHSLITIPTVTILIMYIGANLIFESESTTTAQKAFGWFILLLPGIFIAWGIPSAIGAILTSKTRKPNKAG